MKIIQQKVEILDELNALEILKKIELIGRTCYKSEDKITDDSSFNFVKMLLDRGHEAVIEHFSFSVRFTTDRGISHEIVRHRLASYAQESTRYCDYSKGKFGKELTFIEPSYFLNCDHSNQAYLAFVHSCNTAEKDYFRMLEAGCSPQVARSVLPNCLKTEIVMTANLREWRHFLRLRTSKAAHPDIRTLASSLLLELQEKVLIVFDDIGIEE